MATFGNGKEKKLAGSERTKSRNGKEKTKLVLHSETVKRLSVRTGVRAGGQLPETTVCPT